MKILVPKEYRKALERTKDISGFNQVLTQFDRSLSKGVTDEYLDSFKLREQFCKEVSWFIPTQDVVDLLIAASPVLSVCSGKGYLEAIAKACGVDIICTDIKGEQYDRYCKGVPYIDVLQMDAEEAVNKFPDRNVFMGWPCYAEDTAERLAKAIRKGRNLIFIGEGDGGGNGTDEFFKVLENNYWLKLEQSIPQWYGLHDVCWLYCKNNNADVVTKAVVDKDDLLGTIGDRTLAVNTATKEIIK